jgi:hypothetical protein
LHRQNSAARLIQRTIAEALDHDNLEALRLKFHLREIAEYQFEPFERQPQKLGTRGQIGHEQRTLVVLQTFLGHTSLEEAGLEQSDFQSGDQKPRL